MTFVDLTRGPDQVRAFEGLDRVPLDDETLSLQWQPVTDPGRPQPHDGGVTRTVLRVMLSGSRPVSRVQLRWRADLSAVRRVLPDAWERSYGDLAWLPTSPERVMPWSFVTDDDVRAHGYGVAVRPGAMCFWTADPGGLSLWADVRCGGSPIRLGDRGLHVCDVVAVEGTDGEGAFAVQRRLCHAMSTDPLLPDHAVYGTNDWHFALGGADAEVVLRSSEFVSKASLHHANRPYSVIDDGWSLGGLGHGPWLANQRYGDMGRLATQLGDLGVRPGLWYRPLTPLPEHRDRWRLARGGGGMDPTVPEVAQGIVEQLQRFVGWGYQMIKHDFTVWDLMGRWGNHMGADLTDGGWAFADRSRTTAEVVTDLYALIRRACGPAIVIGCNTFGHLAAGHVELQRIGDDTSGRSWNRTRRMGVNTLAFRAAQHEALYAVDADIAPITPDLPWRQAREWLRLLAASGTPAFVSVDPASRTPEVAAALRDAMTVAAHRQPLAEPLDWTTSMSPSQWRLGAHVVRCDWLEPTGAWPYGD